MNDLSKNVKKPNIFKRLRIKLFLMQKKSIFEKYLKAPDYVKTYPEAIDKLVEFYEEIPEEVIGIVIDKFSIQKQVEFLNNYENKMSITDMEKCSKNIASIMFEEVKKGIYDSVPLLKNIDGINVEIILMNRLRSEWPDFTSEFKQIAKYFNPKKVVRGDLELLKYFEEEQQLDYVKREKQTDFDKYFKYFSIELQLKYIKEHSEYIKFLSYEAAEKFLINSKNPENLALINPIHQIEIIKKNPAAFKYASKIVQIGIYYISSDGISRDNPLKDYGVNPDICFNAFEALLNSDIRNTRHMGNFSDGRLWERNIRIFENCDIFDIEKTKEFFLHSKLFSAAGSLKHFNELSLRTNSNRQNYGRECWDSTQKEIIKKLRIEQIVELLKIDVNYILPYLDNRGNRTKMNEEENEDSKRRAKKLFIEMFGEEKLNEFILNDNGETVIDLIYKLKDHEDNEVRSDKLSLHYFKILFNNQIIKKIEAEKLNKMFIKLKKGEDISEEFRDIICEVYGEHARKILEARPGLDVHSINSLEVFDKRIIDNFGEAFVHNLLSYNFEDFSEFLDIIKTPEKLENFKIYYEVLTNVLGDNIFTAQKAISGYNYIDKLLNNIRDVELTDAQYANLISIMLSEENPYNIDTLEQLERYDEIVKEEAERELRQIENLEEDTPTAKRDSVEIKREGLKEILLEKILGIEIFQWNKISNLYKFAIDEDLYTEEEMKMIEIINFIINEDNPTKLKKFVQEILNTKGLINPIAFHTVIQKTISRETEILNNNLMSREKMDIECEKEKGKEEPLIYKELINGVEVYHLNGIEFSSLQTVSSVDAKTFIEYDGQFGNAAICCRYRKKQLTKSKSEKITLVFLKVDDNMIISNYDDGGTDAMTTQGPKRIRMRGKILKNVANIPEVIYTNNEVAFYRRYIDKNKITNENLGGKRLPDFIVGGTGITPETYAILKKYNIGILIIHEEKYMDKPKINDEKEKE